MKSLILALAVLAPLASTPAAERPSAALRELRVVENEGRTEVVIHVTGEPRYRLFRRLSDPWNPRLTLEIVDAEPAGLSARYAGIHRGGVRELRITPTDSGTVQLAIGLSSAGDRAFGVVRRDGAIVVWMRNGAAPFEPWSSGSAQNAAPAAGARAAGTAPARTAAPAEAGTAPTAQPDNLTLSAAAETAPPQVALADAGSESAAAPAAPGFGARFAARVRAVAAHADKLAGRAADAPGRARPAALDLAIIAILGVAILPVLRLARRTLAPAAAFPGAGTGARWAGTGVRPADQPRAPNPVVPDRPAPKPAPQPTPARRQRERVARASTPSPSAADPRVWAVRTLAAQGATPAEIARTTGLARDAVKLIVRSSVGRADAAGSAAGGTFFRPATHSPRAAAAGAGVGKLLT
jgi:hypothetical protein